MDTSPPSTASFIYACCEELMIPGWKIFKQPSGLSPRAENLSNMPDGYYQRIAFGRPQEWVDVYVHGNYGMADGNMIDYTIIHSDANTVLADVDLSNKYITRVGMQ